MLTAACKILGIGLRAWDHGTVYGYRSGKCRCESCTLVYRAHMRAYQARLNAATGRTTGKRPHIKDVLAPTPMQACGCSLAGIDPPWQWTWNRAYSFTPFSEMTMIPFLPAAHADEGMWTDRRRQRPGRKPKSRATGSSTRP